MPDPRKRTTPIGAADKYAAAEEMRRREAIRQMPALNRMLIHLRTAAVIAIIVAVCLMLAFPAAFEGLTAPFRQATPIKN